ncbi:hypothetical protein BH10PSE18_BH10PSE18_02310 [soil metagenome]
MNELSRRDLLARGAVLAAASGLSAPHVWAQGDFMKPARITVGSTSYISSGPHMIALAKGYFTKLNLDVGTKLYVDGALSLPSLAAGEIDMAGATMSAGLFNLMIKSPGIRIVMERGRESPGMGSNAILVSNALWDKGFRNLDGYKFAKGEKIAVSTRGAVAEYLHVVALKRAGLTPDDVDWQWGMQTRASLPLMKQNQIGVMNLPLPAVAAAVKQGIGKIATWSDEIAPEFVLACSVVGPRMLKEEGYSAIVRYFMGIMKANEEYMEAAQSGNPEILKILAQGTGLPVETINETRPRWTRMGDGIPNISSIVAQQAYWHEKTDLLVKTVPDGQMFDLRAVREARQRMSEKNPFI